MWHREDARTAATTAVDWFLVGNSVATQLTSSALESTDQRAMQLAVVRSSTTRLNSANSAHVLYV